MSMPFQSLKEVFEHIDQMVTIEAMKKEYLRLYREQNLLISQKALLHAEICYRVSKIETEATYEKIAAQKNNKDDKDSKASKEKLAPIDRRNKIRRNAITTSYLLSTPNTAPMPTSSTRLKNPHAEKTELELREELAIITGKIDDVNIKLITLTTQIEELEKVLFKDKAPESHKSAGNTVSTPLTLEIENSRTQDNASAAQISKPAATDGDSKNSNEKLQANEMQTMQRFAEYSKVVLFGQSKTPISSNVTTPQNRDTSNTLSAISSASASGVILNTDNHEPREETQNTHADVADDNYFELGIGSPKRLSVCQITDVDEKGWAIISLQTQINVAALAALRRLPQPPQSLPKQQQSVGHK